MDQVTTYISGIGAWLIDYGVKVLGAVVVLIIGLYLANWIAKLVVKALSRKNIDVSLQSFLGSIVSVGLKVLLLITVAGMIGIQTTSFVAVIGALGLAVGLALQGSLANFAGGVLLLMFKPFKVGDLIESNGQTGHVQSIQIFNTILLTAENKTVILANGAVSNNTIINYSKHGTIRVDIVMAIAPDADVEKARNIALQTMASNKFVLKDPAPSVNVLKIGDGMVTLAIRPFATPPDYWDAFFSVQEELKAAFDKNQVAGPTPTRIIINKQGSN